MATLQTLASRLFVSIFWLTVIPITIWILDYFLAFYIQQLQFFGHWLTKGFWKTEARK